MASTYLSRTPSSAGNRAVWTWSAWVKLSGATSQNEALWNAGGWSAGQDGTGLVYYNNQFLTYWNGPSPKSYSSGRFRDPAAWYHLVFQANTTTLKLWVNGELQNSDTISGDGAINNTTANAIGRYSDNASGFFDGYMADINFTDGTAYGPTTFGQTNSEGVWTPIVNPSVTYGTNGFYLKFENSGAMGTDSSGNSNTFSVAAGTARQIIDTPTDGFCTLNGVRGVIGTNAGNSALSQGNLKAVQSSNYQQCEGTLYPTSGKWYWEAVWVSGTYSRLGVQNTNVSSTDFGSDSGGWRWGSNDGQIYNGTNLITVSTYTTGDVLGFALDLDNGKLYVSKNGTWQNSGDPSAGTGAVATNIPTNTPMSPAGSTGYLPTTNT